MWTLILVLTAPYLGMEKTYKLTYETQEQCLEIKSNILKSSSTYLMFYPIKGINCLNEKGE